MNCEKGDSPFPSEFGRKCCALGPVDKLSGIKPSTSDSLLSSAIKAETSLSRKSMQLVVFGGTNIESSNCRKTAEGDIAASPIEFNNNNLNDLIHLNIST